MSIIHPRCAATLSVVFDQRRTGITSKPLLIEVRPRNASVSVNGYHEADTWNMEVDSQLFPFDPDSVASVAARIYMWNSRGDDSPGYNWAVDKNLMTVGLTDDVKGVLVTEDGNVKLTGRDYTAVLLDKIWEPKNKVPSGKPLDETVQGIADAAAPAGTTARFGVEWRAKEPPPVSGGLMRSTKKKGQWVKPGKTYWDVIYDLVVAHGFIVYVTSTTTMGATIVITDPQTQTQESLASAPRIVYGRNLSSLEVTRKLSGNEKVPQIVIVAWDPKTRKEIKVTYPEKRNTIVDGFAVKKDDQMFFPAPRGVVDRDALLRYARVRFYHLGRTETEYKIGTKFMEVDSPAGEVDLLRLRSGAAIGVQFDPFDRRHLRTMTVAQRVDYIVGMGYQPRIAQFIADNIEGLTQFEQPYYLNKAKFDFDEDDGVDVEMECVNFADQVREDALAALTDAASSGAVAGAVSQ